MKQTKRQFLLLTYLLLAGFLVYQNAQAQLTTFKNSLPQCIYIASYSSGYPWQDRLEQALVSELQGHCQLRTFHMDSKKLKTEKELEAVGLKAKKFIEQNSTDVVIVSDDNAVQYVLTPYFRDSELPFVFCGINNSGGNYGLPYNNTVGMIEVAPTKQLLELLFKLQPGKTHVAYITGPGTTAAKNVVEFHQIVRQLGITSSAHRAHNQEDWRKLYRQLQHDPKVDIILFGNFASFPEWNSKENLQWVEKYTQKMSITTQEWVMPYVALGMTKRAEEQENWAALATIQLLQGVPINQLETVPNHEFIFWFNPELTTKLQFPVPSNVLLHARPFDLREGTR